MQGLPKVHTKFATALGKMCFVLYASMHRYKQRNKPNMKSKTNTIKLAFLGLLALFDDRARRIRAEVRTISIPNAAPSPYW